MLASEREPSTSTNVYYRAGFFHGSPTTVQLRLVSDISLSSFYHLQICISSTSGLLNRKIKSWVMLSILGSNLDIAIRVNADAITLLTCCAIGDQLIKLGHEKQHLLFPYLKSRRKMCTISQNELYIIIIVDTSQILFSVIVCNRNIVSYLHKIESPLIRRRNYVRYNLLLLWKH